MPKTQLRTSQLGGTGLEITRVGFGAWAIGGGGWEFGWGPQQDEESIAAIHRALDLGINWIDTAAAYGFGRSEQVVGRALAGPQRAALCVHQGLAAGRRHRPRPRTVSSATRSCARPKRACGGSASTRSTCTRSTGLIPEQDIEEGWAALAELKERGLVRHIGVSNFNAGAAAPHRLDRAGRDAPAAVLADRPRGRGARSCRSRERDGDRRDRLLADGLGLADRGDDPRADRGDARRRLAQAPTRGSPSRSSPSTSHSPPGCRRSPTGTAARPARSRSPGRCGTRPWTARSPASAARTRWTRSSPRRASSSPART